MLLKLFQIFLLSIFAVKVYCGESGLGWLKKKLPSFKHNWGKLSETQIKQFKEVSKPIETIRSCKTYQLHFSHSVHRQMLTASCWRWIVEMPK